MLWRNSFRVILLQRIYISELKVKPGFQKLTVREWLILKQTLSIAILLSSLGNSWQAAFCRSQSGMPGISLLWTAVLTGWQQVHLLPLKTLQHYFRKICIDHQSHAFWLHLGNATHALVSSCKNIILAGCSTVPYYFRHSELTNHTKNKNHGLGHWNPEEI